MNNIPTNTKVVVTWTDARIYPGTHKLNEALDKIMPIFESLGFVVSTDETVIRMAHERADDGSYRDILLIPTGTVLSIKPLSEQEATADFVIGRYYK